VQDFLVSIKGSQFHYGSIKTKAYCPLFAQDNLSQFHYGSIKTLITKNYVLLRGESQFHYGSIKTKYVRSPLNYIENLNSTMVRLKLTELQQFLTSIKISIPLWFD